MNPNEREPIYSSELRGRMEEHQSLVEFLDTDLAEKIVKVDARLEGLEDMEFENEVADLITVLSRLSIQTDTTQWILALRRSGVADEVILRIWDRKNEIAQTHKEQE